MNKKTIIISGGGTGGHIFPAIEIAKAFQRKHPNINIIFVGASQKMEMIKVPKAGFYIIGLWIQGLYRNSFLKNILFPIKLAVSLLQSLFILIYYRPDSVIGTGGFASGPILFMASLLGFKTYIQEQNYFAGLTNKILSNRVDKIFVAYDGMDKFFPKNKIFKFGNPVRHSLKKTQDNSISRKFFGLKPHKFTILVIGGSLGAEPINKSISNTLSYLLQYDYQFIWQTGYRDYVSYVNLKSKNVSVHKFIDRMDLAYAASDIVISRAGAIAISELSFLKKPSILIPSPYVANDHQAENARYLQRNDACIFIKENKLNSQLLIDSIDKMQDSSFRNQIGCNAERLFNYNAADKIVETILIDMFNVK